MGVSEILVEWNCGASTPPGDAKAFASALIDLANTRESLPELGRNALRLAKSEFNWDQLFDRLNDLITEVSVLCP